MPTALAGTVKSGTEVDPAWTVSTDTAAGAAGAAASDVVSGHFPDIKHVAAGAVSGATYAAVYTVTRNWTAAGAASGAAGDAFTQTWDIVSGAKSGYDLGELATSTLLGAGAGFIGGRISGRFGPKEDLLERRLNGLKNQAEAEAKADGLTKRQQAATEKNLRLEPMFRGERADAAFRRVVARAMKDEPALRERISLTPRGKFGPDVNVNPVSPKNSYWAPTTPSSPTWFDLTTMAAFPAHEVRYGPVGRGLFRI